MRWPFVALNCLGALTPACALLKPKQRRQRWLASALAGYERRMLPAMLNAMAGSAGPGGAIGVSACTGRKNGVTYPVLVVVAILLGEMDATAKAKPTTDDIAATSPTAIAIVWRRPAVSR